MAKYEVGSYVDYQNTQWIVKGSDPCGKSLVMYWLRSVYAHAKYVNVLEEQLSPSRMWERPGTDAGTSRAVKNYAGQTIRH